MKGWIEQAPFDRIIVTAAAGDEPPQALLDQMSLGGIMIIPMGRDKASQFIYRITRMEEGYRTEQLMPVRFVPLLPNVAKDEVDPVIDDVAENFVTAQAQGMMLQPA
jgi:protein-L-isoaspartate(D-aspartate) O-methyltransferase